MAASGLTAQQLNQVESLADDALVGVKAVIRDDDESSVGGHRTVLDTVPQAPNERIDFLQSCQMRFAVIVVMCRMVEIHSQQIEIAHPLVAKTGNQFAFQLSKNNVSGVQPGNKLSRQIDGIPSHKLRFGRQLQRL